MTHLNNAYHFILEIDKLKQVYRNTITVTNRKESTAEHSWSASMIVTILMQELRAEFEQIDELKTIKLCLIHDLVEIYAGDVIAFDLQARKEKEQVEREALKKLIQIHPEFGQELHSLWYEFEEKQSIEAQVAKAADSICPIFQRLHSNHSYLPFNVTIADLDHLKKPIFDFSKTFCYLYEKLKEDLISAKLIPPPTQTRTAS